MTSDLNSMRFGCPQSPSATASPQGEAARGALMRVPRDGVLSGPCSVAEVPCDAGQVPLSPQEPDVGNEDVHLRPSGTPRFPGFVSESSRSVLNDRYVGHRDR